MNEEMQQRLEYVQMKEEETKELQQLARDWQEFVEKIEDCLSPIGQKAFRSLKGRNYQILTKESTK